MTDPIALTTVAAQVAAPGSAAAATTAASAAVLPPAETQMFATLMKGATGVAPSAAGTPGGFGTVSTSFVEQWSNTRSFEDIRHSMLQSFDAGDPIKSMFAMTSNAMEAQMLFSKLHISTSLASAASSLFGNLLKNQQ
jgi:hypothetical protein